MIRFKNIQFTYSNQTMPAILTDLNIAQGECIVLCGKSGSGKTSITRLINGLIPEYYEGTLSGSAQVAEYKPGVDEIEDMSKSVGSVFQNPATQFFHKIVEHELVFPCENQGMSMVDINARLEQTVRFFQIEHLLQKNLQVASGGERQRVAVATAMMQAPKIVVFDEPTANLDTNGIKQVAEYIKHLKEANVTVVIAEHRVDFLKTIADRYLYIEKGEVVYQWNNVQWGQLTNDERAKLGLRGVNLTVKPHQFDYSLQRKGLRIHNVTLVNGQQKLGNISEITFPTNHICALIGRNGVGKSTLAHVIAGLKKSAGAISYDGKMMQAKERIQNTAFVMQEVRLQLFAESVEKEIQLGMKANQKYASVVEQLGLSNLLKRHPMSLSGGEQQRVIIANALLSNKKVFIFDEPTSGLDYTQMQHFASLLKDLKDDNRVIIVITHDMELIEAACDGVVDLETAFY